MDNTLVIAERGEPGPARPTLSLWPAVWKLLRLRALITISSFRRANLRRKVGMIVLGLLALGVVAVVLFLSWGMLRLLRSPQLSQILGDVSLVIETVPVLIFTGAFIGVLFTSFGVLLQGLYLAGDMDFLLASPVPIRAVFLTKLLQAILPNFALISLFALPVLFGLGISSGYNLLFYPLAVLHLVALALEAAGLAGLLVLLTVRVFPARRVAEVLGFLGAILSFVCSQTGNVANLEGVGPGQTTQLFQSLSELNADWLPLAWSGRSLVDVGAGRWGSGVLYGFLSLGLAALIFGFALNAAERLYYSGWANIRIQRRKKKNQRVRTRQPQPAFITGAFHLIPPQVRAILVKDFYVMRRDLRNMSHIITPLIFGIIYAFMFLRGGPEFDDASGQAPPVFAEILSNITIYANVGISLFVGWMLVARLGMIGFSQEGKSYWILKSAPVTTRKLLTAKFLVAFVPSLILGWLFLVGISLIQRAEFITVLFTLLVVAFTMAGNAGLNLAFGVIGARFDWEDPRKMNQGAAGCFGSLAGMAFLGLSLLLFFGPPVAINLLALPEFVGQLAGLTLGGLFSLAITFGSLWAVRDRVRRLNES